MSDDILIVYCMVPTDDKAHEMARGLVEGHLAACVNIVPAVRSVFRWKGGSRPARSAADHQDDAAPLGALVQWIENAHPYEVPEILAVPAARSSVSYARWVREETKPPA